MRVITGIAGGRKLSTLEGEATRPTGDKVKEGIFSAIQFDIEGRRVLDLFAGSGQLGIEALSRGASFALFCDNNPAAVKVIKANIDACGFADQAKVVASGYAEALCTAQGKFDIAFLDPPYAAGILLSAAEGVAKIMNPYGMIICEHPPEVTLPSLVSDFSIVKEYKYGKISVTVYAKES